MPSPVGHVLAGVTVAWAAEALAGRQPREGAPALASPRLPAITPLVAACAALALAPDLDILLAHHRAYSHSIGAAAAVGLICGAIARARGGRGLAAGLACGATIWSHALLDWLGRDSSTPIGLMALWPLSSSYVYSGVELFADISRRYWKPEEFFLKNAAAVARELLLLAPPAARAWWARQRSLARHRNQPGA